MVEEIKFVLPEIIIAGFACLVLLLDLLKTRYRKIIIYLCALIGLLVAGISTLAISGVKHYSLLNGSYILDNFSILIKLLFYLITAIIFVYSRQYLLFRDSQSGEYYALCLFSLLGMMVLISSASLITMYLGLELFALPLYALITYVKGNKLGVEAAMKYFIMGGLASGLLLYGISLLYGITGTFGIAEVSSKLTSLNMLDLNNMVLQFGVMFVLTGLAFKLGAAPFHMWVPDAYQGASTPVTLLISTTPKLAGFGMAFRLLGEGFQYLHNSWQPLLIIMAVLSLAIGNIAAIMQTNLKRLLAYSTIAHIGFVLLGLIVAPHVGYATALFYMVVYVITTLAAFGIMIFLSSQGLEADNIDDYKGLVHSSPWLAFLMLIILFSLIGIPPLAGFSAKFLVLRDLINSGFEWLAVTAVVFSVIAAFYYLRIIKVMFFDNPSKSEEKIHIIGMSRGGRVILSVNSLILLITGIFPGSVVLFCEYAIA